MTRTRPEGCTTNHVQYELTNTNSRTSPAAGLLDKAREAARWTIIRTKVVRQDHKSSFQPISEAQLFSHYYVEPQISREGKNDRIMLGQCQAKATVRDGRGQTQELIHAASHNYAGFYTQTTHSEQLQQLCLDSLPIMGALPAPTLEAALCQKFKHHFAADFCCTTSTGYGANLLAIPAILDNNWLVILDEKCHNSMFVGAYQSQAGLIKRFGHNRMDDLEKLLQAHHHKYQILVAVEGVYSMDGTVPPLDQLADMKQHYRFSLLADEAHSLSSLGRTGRGCVEMWNDEHAERLLPLDLIDVRTATLSKAFGAIGGVVFGRQRFQTAVLSRQDTLLRNGSEPLQPSAMVQSLHVLGQPLRLQRHLRRLSHITSFVQSELRRLDIYIYGNANTPILSIHAGRPSVAARLSYILRKLGVLATPIATPAVPMWEARVRVCLSAEFNDATVNQLVRTIVRAARLAGIAQKTDAKFNTFHYNDINEHDQTDEDAEASTSYNSIRELVLRDKESIDDTALLPSNVIEAGHAARHQYGVASGAPRWTAGTYATHLEVEKTLAISTETSEAMTFPDSYVGLMSTVAALCRPPIGCDKHYLLIPENAPMAVRDGIRVAPNKGRPTIIEYNNLSTLVQHLGPCCGKAVAITLYLDSDLNQEDLMLHNILGKITQSKTSTNLTVLLRNHESPEQVPKMNICKTIQDRCAQLLVYGSFNEVFGLPGAYLTGSTSLINELRYTNRGYMFTTSQMPYVMGMIAEALKS